MQDEKATRPQPRRSPSSRRAAASPTVPDADPVGRDAPATVEPRLQALERQLQAAAELVEQGPRATEERLTLLEKDLLRHRTAVDNRLRDLHAITKSLTTDVGNLVHEVQQLTTGPSSPIGDLRHDVHRLVGQVKQLKAGGDPVALTDTVTAAMTPLAELLDEVAGRVDALAGRIGELDPTTHAGHDVLERMDEVATSVLDQGARIDALSDAVRTVLEARAASPPPPVAPPTPAKDVVLDRLEQQLAHLSVEVRRLADRSTETTDEMAAIWGPTEVDDPETAREELISWVIEVDGVGPARANALADAFGDLDELASATVDDVVTLTGLNPKVAAAVLDYVTG